MIQPKKKKAKRSQPRLLFLRDKAVKRVPCLQDCTPAAGIFQRSLAYTFSIIFIFYFIVIAEGSEVGHGVIETDDTQE